MKKIKRNQSHREMREKKKKAEKRKSKENEEENEIYVIIEMKWNISEEIASPHRNNQSAEIISSLKPQLEKSDTTTQSEKKKKSISRRPLEREKERELKMKSINQSIMATPEMAISGEEEINRLLKAARNGYNQSTSSWQVMTKYHLVA